VDVEAVQGLRRLVRTGEVSAARATEALEELGASGHAAKIEAIR